MKLHVLVHQIVSLRIQFGNYEDSATVRNKLAAETMRSICKRKELQKTDELEQAQRLLACYAERAKGRPTLRPVVTPKPRVTITYAL